MRKMKTNNAAEQILTVISFSATGAALARHLKESLPGMSVRLYGKYSAEAATEEEISVKGSITVWAGERMAEKDAILFIGASGIAVRSIAPHIRNKLADSPVLVMDELGKHIIPLLSGHVGGANELALLIAEAIGADPVITTATDLHERFAVDVFAKKQHLRIVNKNGIAPVSSKVLRGEMLTMAVQDGCIPEKALDKLPENLKLVPYEALSGVENANGNAASDPENADEQAASNPEDAAAVNGAAQQGEGISVDILVAADDLPAKRTICLAPKPYVIGIGCRKGKEPEAVEAFVNQVLSEHRISVREVYAAVSIDVKKDEEGILAYCRKYKLPYIVYSADELLAAPGEYDESAFVRATVGVGNVCERSAALAAAEIAAEVSERRNIKREDTEQASAEMGEDSDQASAQMPEGAEPVPAEECEEKNPVFVCRKTKGDGVTCAIAAWR